MQRKGVSKKKSNVDSNTPNSSFSKTNREGKSKMSTFNQIEKEKKNDYKHYIDSQFYSIKKTLNQRLNEELKLNEKQKQSTTPLNNISNTMKNDKEEKIEPKINKEFNSNIKSENKKQKDTSITSTLSKEDKNCVNKNESITDSKKSIKDNDSLSSSYQKRINDSNTAQQSSNTPEKIENNITSIKASMIPVSKPTQNKEPSQPSQMALPLSNQVIQISQNQKGLNNLGNTCFMNTCLQNLIHCSPFIARLFDPTLTLRPGKLTREFMSICKTQISTSSRSSSPSEFKSAFGSIHSEYRGYRQHDTQEFCRLLLEDISKELNTVKKIPPYKEIDSKGKTRFQLNKEFDEIFRARENSIVIDTFYGQIENVFICPCKFESFSFEKFLDIPILLNDGGSQNLNELLKKNFENDSIVWGAKCENCGKITTHIKESKLSILPEVLILSLQRCNGRTKRKNSASVKFGEYIDLSKFVDKECLGNIPTKYNLIGIGNHSGSIDFGHYYAYIKINNSWYEFNDSFTSSCGGISLDSSGAYVLFYQREDII